MSSISNVVDFSFLSDLSFQYLKINHLQEKITRISFCIGSYLTDPICKAHETFRCIYLVDYLGGSMLSKSSKKVVLVAMMALHLAIALFTTIPGVGARSLGVYLQTDPFIYLQNEEIKNKSLETSFFTMLSWNVCCVGAGYPITDGGVAPWRYRIDQILEKILQTDADLNCLYETFDYSAAQYLASQLGQKGYPHVYFNIGARAIGVNSGILLASKFEIKNPEFNLFSKETLVGRTEYAAKGVFGFELVSEKKSFARIYATHLQHSEKPSFPTDEEVVARAGQMSQVMGKVEEVAGRCLIVAGDLNLDEKEYEKSFLKKEFSWIRPEDPFKKSWGGDAFCGMVQK